METLEVLNFEPTKYVRGPTSLNPFTVAYWLEHVVEYKHTQECYSGWHNT